MLTIATNQIGQYSEFELFQRRHVMSSEVTPILTAQDCLVAMMMAIAISDSNIRTAELVKIQSAVNNLPIFAEYDIDRLNIISQTVFDLFEQEDGLDALFGLVRDHLPSELKIGRAHV